MKHYMDPGSGSCRRVSAVARHLGLELEEVFVDLLKGENRQPSFLALNPNGMVPTLEDGEVVLWEAAAIMIRLAETVDETELWPKGSARHDVLRWMFWAAEQYRQAPPMLLEERLFKKYAGQPSDESRIAEALRRFERFTPILDSHLEGRKYVVGETVTLADFDLAAPLSHIRRADIPFDRFSNILRWNERLHEEVPAWRETGARLNERMDRAEAEQPQASRT